jgi:Ca2+-binding RTX toxin-like protein
MTYNSGGWGYHSYSWGYNAGHHGGGHGYLQYLLQKFYQAWKAKYEPTPDRDPVDMGVEYLITGDAGDNILKGLRNVENRIIANDGDDIAKGGNKSDYILGNGGDDILKGRGGDDCLFGGLGDDVLKGGRGDDQLSGDLGTDIMTGGRGEDSFVFRKRGVEGDDTVDTITDFNAHDDRIVFDGIDEEEVSFVQVGCDVSILVSGTLEAIVEGAHVNQFNDHTLAFDDVIIA